VKGGEKGRESWRKAKSIFLGVKKGKAEGGCLESREACSESCCLYKLGCINK